MNHILLYKSAKSQSATKQTMYIFDNFSKLLVKFYRITLCLAVRLAMGAGLMTLSAHGQTGPDVVSGLLANNVTWTNPGPTSLQSMPLGNGDIALNVWAETNGAVDFYIGKSDAWGDNVQGDQGLMKVGGVRIAMTPNPLVSGAPFEQTLKLHEGQIQISEGSGTNAVQLLIWVDANNPVIRIEATSAGTPTTFQATLLNWRLGSSHPGIASSDVVLAGQTNAVGWYHRNSSSDDPHVANWTFGAIFQGAGMTNSNSTNLVSSLPVTNEVISVYPLTTRTGSLSQWKDQLLANIDQMNSLDLATTRTKSEAWWDGFWLRSWIFITGDQSAINTTEGYVLQRFISACAGRGAYPIKFNGSLFVVDNPSVPYTPDGRRWGGQYWMQNTRLMYWPMLGAGDFDLMQPFFNMYAQIISNNTSQVENYYGHGGSYSAETSPFWGGLSNVSTNVVPINSSSLFTVRYFEGVLELGMMMLDYYDYTGDTNFLENTLVPTVSAGLDFYDQHFGLDANGKMLLYPVNSLETYWDTYNPAPDIAGLKAVLPRMLALPTNYVSAVHQAQWTRMVSEIPSLPLGTNGGATVLLPYSGPQTNGIRNGENTELYAVFPYRIYGLNKPNLQIAVNTYNKRLFHGLGWADWMPDPIQAAMIGLGDEAKQYTVYNMTNKDPSLKFPAFWREQNDYEPSQDTGGVAEDALQKMIMQTDGNSIMLLPAWPTDWNATFKLHAPQNTTVQGTITNGVVTNLVVTPSSRMADIVFMNGQGMPPEAPTNLTAQVGNGEVTLHWSQSPNALGYVIERSLSSGGSYFAIATNYSELAYTDTNVIGGTTYYYVISALSISGESANSSQISVVALLTIPSAPTGLSAIPGDGLVSLSWVASSGATNYYIKRSTINGEGYGTIASGTATHYIDSQVSNGTMYYYVISAENSLGEGTNSAQVSAKPMSSAGLISFTSGAFTANSVLGLVGTPAQELYGVNLGDGTGRITANGYTFDSYPSSDITYGGSGGYSPGAIFLGGGGTSGDSSFDGVLNSGQLGINSGALILKNLTVGATYKVLFLEADTRNDGEAGRAFNISWGGTNSAMSPSQVYAFAGGTPSLGGYILATFQAVATTQAFTNTAAGYGYQLNGVLVATVPFISMNPPVIQYSINDHSINFNWPSDHIGWRLEEQANVLGAGLSSNWFTVTGSSASNQASVPVNTSAGSVFYRLVYP